MDLSKTVTAALIPVGEVEDDEGRFRIQFGCTGSLAGGATATARLNGVPVANGQVVELDVDDGDDERDAEFDRGRLAELEAPSFRLAVTCHAAAGNLATATATLRFPGDDSDD